MAFDPTKYGLTNDTAIGYLKQNPSGSVQWLNEHGISSNDVADWATNIGKAGTVSHLYSEGGGSFPHPTGGVQTHHIGGNNTNSVSQVRMPGFIDRQASINASIPNIFRSLTTSYLPKFDSAYDTYAKLPATIDQWKQDALRGQRLTGDQSASILNQVANARAGSGIMGGTEANNLKADLFARTTDNINRNRTNINQAYDSLKAKTIAGMPTQALAPIQTGTALYGTTSNEAANWGNLAARMLLNTF